MKNLGIIKITPSEKGLEKLAELTAKNKIRLKKMVDEFIKIEIPSMGIVTWARDAEDAKTAINESIELFFKTEKTFGK